MHQASVVSNAEISVITHGGDNKGARGHGGSRRNYNWACQRNGNGECWPGISELPWELGSQVSSKGLTSFLLILPLLPFRRIEHQSTWMTAGITSTLHIPLFYDHAAMYISKGDPCARFFHFFIYFFVPLFSTSSSNYLFISSSHVFFASFFILF